MIQSAVSSIKVCCIRYQRGDLCIYIFHACACSQLPCTMQNKVGLSKLVMTFSELHINSIVLNEDTSTNAAAEIKKTCVNSPLQYSINFKLY